MTTLLLAAVGIIVVVAYARRLPRAADRVSDEWLKNYVRADGADLEVDPSPVMRLVKTEGSSAPGAYSKPAGN